MHVDIFYLYAESSANGLNWESESQRKFEIELVNCEM